MTKNRKSKINIGTMFLLAFCLHSSLNAMWTYCRFVNELWHSSSYSSSDLIDAVQNGNLQQVKTILDYGVSPDSSIYDKLGIKVTALEIAIYNKNKLVAQELIARGATKTSYHSTLELVSDLCQPLPTLP